LISGPAMSGAGRTSSPGCVRRGEAAQIGCDRLHGPNRPEPATPHASNPRCRSFASISAFTTAESASGRNASVVTVVSVVAAHKLANHVRQDGTGTAATFARGLGQGLRQRSRPRPRLRPLSGTPGSRFSGRGAPAPVPKNCEERASLKPVSDDCHDDQIVDERARKAGGEGDRGRATISQLETIDFNTPIGSARSEVQTPARARRRRSSAQRSSARMMVRRRTV
jgi:hypothetical protein